MVKTSCCINGYRGEAHNHHHEMTMHILYSGALGSGKSTNLKYIHEQLSPSIRSEMVLLDNAGTFFQFLAPRFSGLQVKCSLYEPTNDHAMRKMFEAWWKAWSEAGLLAAPGIVFVADSQPGAKDANIDALTVLNRLLSDRNASLGDNEGEFSKLPRVLQFNKRDVNSPISLSELQSALNSDNVPTVEATAISGLGVFDTLNALMPQIYRSVDFTDAELSKFSPILPMSGSGPSASPAKKTWWRIW